MCSACDLLIECTAGETFAGGPWYVVRHGAVTAQSQNVDVYPSGTK